MVKGDESHELQLPRPQQGQPSEHAGGGVKANRVPGGLELHINHLNTPIRMNAQAILLGLAESVLDKLHEFGKTELQSRRPTT